MHVTVNAAMSSDGKLSSRRRDQVRISGSEDFARVDRLRAKSDAVMVGVGTVLADDPSLTVKDADLVAAREERGGPSHPARVVADSRARTPLDARVLDGEATTYVLVSDDAPAERCDALRDAGAAVVIAGDARTDLPAALDALGRAGVDRLMVEGGGEVIFSLFDAGVVDRLSTFIGPLVIGGRDAPTLADGAGFVEEFPSLALDDVTHLDEGVVLTWHAADR